MISQIFIERAIGIRKEYLSLNKDANNYQKLIESLKNKVEDTIGGLEDLIKNIDNLT